ncbi:MAG: hypothetical protein HYS74_02390 [Parcubacteria group bacterium]|nr:hypothetical protein [Parcubacteria group bacterium]
MNIWRREPNHADGDRLEYRDSDDVMLVSARLSYVYCAACERHIVIVTDVAYRSDSQEHHRRQWLQALALKVREKADERNALAVFLFDPETRALVPFSFIFVPR